MANNLARNLNLCKDNFSYIYGKWVAKDLKPEEEDSVEGKIVLITGADGGIGKCAVHEFAKRGAKVILACLNMKDGLRTIKEIREMTPKGEMFMHKLDLSNLESVRKFAREIISTYPHINILICNAGIGTDKLSLRRTIDGLEETMSINYFGHFLLTNLLLDHIKKGAPSKILFTASTLHILADLDLDKINFEGQTQLPYIGKSYGNSKLCLMIFAQELAMRLKDQGVTTCSYCPGLVDTPIFNNCSRIGYYWAKMMIFLFGHQPEKGCQVILYTALAKQTRNESGLMYRSNAIWVKATKKLKKKQNMGKKLFEKSSELVGLKY